MTLTQLQYALALKSHRGFNKAAQSLNISQPALSLQIQKLEEEISIRLFNRSSLPIEVTEDGQGFLLRAEEIVKSAEQLKQYARNVCVDFTGHLKLGIIPTLAPFLVPLFADAMMADHPSLHLEIAEKTTENVVAGVRSGDLDVGIISTPIKVYGIRSIPIFYEKFYLYTSEVEYSTTDIRLEDVNYDKLWLLEEGNCFRDQINDFCNLNQIRKDKHFIYRSNSIDALIRIVDTKGGLTILPELTTLSLSAKQEENIHDISGKPKAREISLIVNNSPDKERYIEKLKYYITSNVPKHMLDRANYEIVDPNIQIK